MVFDRETLKSMLQTSKNRKCTLEGEKMAVLIDVMQIIILEKQIQSDLMWIELVEENPSTPPFECFLWQEHLDINM